jgi:magnesium transporter
MRVAPADQAEARQRPVMLAFARRVSRRMLRAPEEPTGNRQADVRAHLYDADGEDRELTLEAVDIDELHASELLWLDVSDLEHAEQATAALGLAAGTGVRLEHAPARADVGFHTDYVHITVVVTKRTALGYEGTPLHCLVGENWIVTVHHAPVAFLERFSDRITGDSGLGRLDAAGLAAVFLHEHIASYLREVEPLELELERIDLQSMTGRATEDAVLRQLVSVRQRLAHLRRLLAPHRELYGRLALPDFALLSESDSPEAFASLSDRSEQALQALDATREMILNSFDIYTTWTAHETNRVMRLLTVASVTLLPPTLLASVMGMNSLPNVLASAQAFDATLAVMTFVGATVLAVARRRRWI